MRRQRACNPTSTQHPPTHSIRRASAGELSNICSWFDLCVCTMPGVVSFLSGHKGLSRQTDDQRNRSVVVQGVAGLALQLVSSEAVFGMAMIWTKEMEVVDNIHLGREAAERSNTNRCPTATAVGLPPPTTTVDGNGRDRCSKQRQSAFKLFVRALVYPNHTCSLSWHSRYHHDGDTVTLLP